MLGHTELNYWLSRGTIASMKLTIIELSVRFSIKVHTTSEWYYQKLIFTSVVHLLSVLHYSHSLEDFTYRFTFQEQAWN